MDWKPEKISDVELAFPANALERMPSWEDLPHPFGDASAQDHHPAMHLAKRLFGGPSLPPGVTFHSVEGVDAEMAVRHIHYILRSYMPKHEHKMGTAAYFISIWFEKVTAPDGDMLWQAPQ